MDGISPRKETKETPFIIDNVKIDTDSDSTWGTDPEKEARFEMVL